MLQRLAKYSRFCPYWQTVFYSLLLFIEMNLIKKIRTGAFWRNIENKGYNYSIRKIIWQSKKIKWNWISISYGIRRSDKRQYFPIWNMSCNTSRSLLFGFNFWYFQLTYHRKKPFNQKRKFILRNKLWSFYQLFF